MKKSIVILFVFAVVLGFSFQAHADLELIGQGTSAHGTYNLIYDTDLDITWYDYTRSGSTNAIWQNQMDWADALSVTTAINTYDDWRLPITFDQSCRRFDCTNSELGHLYFTELENVGFPTDGYGLSNTGDFQNLLSSLDFYWSSTEYADDPDIAAWGFEFSGGRQTTPNKLNFNPALAVMDGRAVVPEPISSILFLVGGATLGFRRFRKRVSG